MRRLHHGNSGRERFEHAQAFFASNAAFIAAFTLTFTWPKGTDARRKAVAAAVAVAFGLALAGGVATLFRYGFLVRLP